MNEGVILVLLFPVVFVIGLTALLMMASSGSQQRRPNPDPPPSKVKRNG